MMPQAMLQPRAPMSMVRTSSRPASATLREPVKVRTIIRPKSTSAIRSFGSSKRLDVLTDSAGINHAIVISEAGAENELHQAGQGGKQVDRRDCIEHQHKTPTQQAERPLSLHTGHKVGSLLVDCRLGIVFLLSTPGCRENH